MYLLDVAPSQDASGKWRFIGIPEPKNVTILVVTGAGRGQDPTYPLVVDPSISGGRMGRPHGEEEPASCGENPVGSTPKSDILSYYIVRNPKKNKWIHTESFNNEFSSELQHLYGMCLENTILEVHVEVHKILRKCLDLRSQV